MSFFTPATRPRAGFIAISLAFTYLFFFEYLPPVKRVHIPFDLHGYHDSLFVAAFDSLKHGRIPEWDPSIYCGFSFAGNIQAQLFYPPMWLLFLANARHEQPSYTSLEIFQLLHIWIGFALFFAWLRGRGLRPLACALGAGVYAFGGYACLQLQHLGLICGYAWFPLGFMGIDQAVRTGRWRPLWKTTAASALCFLAGYPPTWFAFAVSLGAYAMCCGFATTPGAAASRLAAGSQFQRTARIVIGTAMAIAMSIAICAVQALPTFESSTEMTHDDRYGVGMKEGAYYLSALVPNYYNFDLGVPVETNPGRDYLYLGAPAIFGSLWIAGAMIFFRRKTREALPILAVGLTGVIFLTNPYGLVLDVIGHSSMLQEICRDWYFLAAVSLAIAALAAYGIDDFLNRPARPAPRWLAAGAVVIVAIWARNEILRWSRSGHFAHGARAIYAPAISLAIFALALFMARGQKGAWRMVMACAILVSVAADYKVFGTSKRFNAAPGPVRPEFTRSHFVEIEPQAYSEIQAHREYRVVTEGGPDPLQMRQAGLLTPQGFDPFIPARYRRLLEGNANFVTDRRFDLDPQRTDLMRLFGVRYVITWDQHPVYTRLIHDPNFRMLGEGNKYYKVFEYLGAVPPFGWENPGPGESAKLVSWTPEQRDFEVGSSAGGVFVFKEEMFAGWQASVDGRSVPIAAWNGAFGSVKVPGGEHRVEFLFRSRGLRVGAWISAAALVATVAMVAVL
ncbi:MAG TPA: YfhO family protein [Bryobacteraceae bacterium]|nr:YfhO family protein [Bryobacteraceae bacterium]